ncbi:trypsin-like serine peptidase [Kitasatospora sp. NPDC051705]|uniref:trypsin-like serine peptidase n=1 Tax=Kitasatospora sp. NPDC051705 TaxID=3364057 RepID=UPI003787DD9A
MPKHTGRAPRRRPAAAGAAVLAALVLTATACGPDGPGAPAPPPAALPRAVPTGPDDLAGWKLEDWTRYVADSGSAEEAPPDAWTAGRMAAAKGRPTPEYPLASAPAGVQHDAPPPAGRAVPQPRPYGPASAVVGRLFAGTAHGDTACSGTVVSDPANPGRSNLVYTAAHCLHEGGGGGWLKGVTFVPGYNRDGGAVRGRPATEQQLAPYGRWTAVRALVSPTWLREGGVGARHQYDYGIVRVRGEEASGPSLEEVVGAAVPVWFNAPREQVTSAAAYGYPAERPSDGLELDRCDAATAPGRLSFDRARPPMYVIGCPMTGGADGGGWFITKDGKPNLVSVTALGGRTPDGYLAGPALQDQAKRAFDFFSKSTR